MVTVIPMVARKSQISMWRHALGTWDFKYGETNNYQSAIYVQMGGDLDIAYQGTGMKIGEQEHVLHYGFSGNPRAVSLSKKRVKKAFALKNSSSRISPDFNYQPPHGIIIV